MLLNSQQNQLASYFEDEMLRNAGQRKERGYTGTGYWYSNYPAYMGAGNTMYGAMSTATDPGAPTDTVGSAVEAAAGEAGAFGG